MTDLAPDPATPPPRTSRASLPLFVAAEAFSLFGNSAIAIVLPWLVLTRTGDPAVTGLVAAVAALPAILAALVGGWLIDKVGQRRMSVLADFGSAVSVAGLAVVDRVFGLDLGWFIALGILGALFDVPGMTARETLMGRVARTSGVSLDKIASLRQAVFSLAFLGGPALAGVLLAILDPIQVVWVTAGCSLAAGICMLILPLTAPEVASADTADIGGVATIRAQRPAAGHAGDRLRQRPRRRPAARGAAARALQRVGGADLVRLHHVRVRGRVDGRRDPVRGHRRPVAPGRLRRRPAAADRSGWSASPPCTGSGRWRSAPRWSGSAAGCCRPVFIVFFTEQVAESVRGRVLGLFNALALIASPLGLGAIALALSVTTLEVAATWLLAAWVLVMAYAFISKGMRTFAESPAPRSARSRRLGRRRRADRADH